MKKMIIVLTIVMVVAGLVLASSYAVFEPQIEKNQKQALQASLEALFQGSGKLTFTKLDTGATDIYAGKTANGTLAGYAVRVTGSGYGGEIQMLVGVSPDLKTIAGFQVVDNVETPGLGSRITEDWFRNQFKGLDPSKTITYIKNAKPDAQKNQIEAISGSTISTRAVTTALSETLQKALPSIIKASGSSATGN
jgi:RnfABCDGE-type electron transport complex G subunit